MQAPRPRLCHLRKWPDFNGYGFNLHAEKGKSGQFIGTVDPRSPSDAAGLKAGDRIVEVNGVNIGSENHQQVVQRIKSVASETRLLVVDAEADGYFRSKGTVVRGDSADVDHRETPIVNPYTAHDGREEVEAESVFRASVNEGDKSYDPPRLCHLRRWLDFEGYGFNLHSEKGKPGQFIGNVDPNSPAEAAGLRAGDRIVEVNGSNVMSELHPAVVSKIKTYPNEVKIFVVDVETEQHYRSRGIGMTSDMSEVRHIECPTVSPNSRHSDSNGSHREDEEQEQEEVLQRDEEHREGSESGNGLDRQVSLDASENEREMAGGTPHFYDEADAIGPFTPFKMNNEHEEEVTEVEQYSPPRSVPYVEEHASVHAAVVAQSAHHSAPDPTTQHSLPPTPDPVMKHSPPSAPEPASSTSNVVSSTSSYSHSNSSSSTASHISSPPPSIPTPSLPHVSSVSSGSVGGTPAGRSTAPSSTSSSGGGGVTVGGIQFAGSAKEAREKMKSSGKQRVAVKTSSMSYKDKYDLLQKL